MNNFSELEYVKETGSPPTFGVRWVTVELRRSTTTHPFSRKELPEFVVFEKARAAHNGSLYYMLRDCGGHFIDNVMNQTRYLNRQGLLQGVEAGLSDVTWLTVKLAAD